MVVPKADYLFAHQEDLGMAVPRMPNRGKSKPSKMGRRPCSAVADLWIEGWDAAIVFGGQVPDSRR